MSGSGLMAFLISIILLIATGAIFFLVVDRMAPDPLLNKIGKIAVGVLLLVIFLLSVSGVLFGGGGALHLDPKGFLYFCIGVIVILVVLFIIEFVLNTVVGWFSSPGQNGQGGVSVAPLVALAKYVIFAVALIALLVVADRTMLGGSYTGEFDFGARLR